MTDTVKQDIVKWLNGDDAAYRRIFDAYYPKLFRICLKSIKQTEDSEEMVMNVFFNMWQRRAELGKVEDFTGYFIKSLRNQIADHKRKNILKTQVIHELPLEALGSVQHPEVTFSELEEIYRKALDKLSDKQREVFLMSREHGKSQKEIAEEKNLSPSTVNNHITAAMKIIRNDLGAYSEALPIILMFASIRL